MENKPQVYNREWHRINIHIPMRADRGIERDDQPKTMLKRNREKHQILWVGVKNWGL